MESSRLKALGPQLAELSPDEVRALAEDLTLRALLDAAKTKTVDWERFDGVLKHGPDGLEYQRAIRAEGLSAVLDTNIAIHKLHGELEEALPAQGALISVITESELLGFSGMTPAHEADVRALIATLTVIPLNGRIKDETIRLRKTLRLRLPDAIVLANAAITGSELLTNDLEPHHEGHSPRLLPFPCHEAPRLSGAALDLPVRDATYWESGKGN